MDHRHQTALPISANTHSTLNNSRQRKLQHVLTHHQRRIIVRWMINNASTEGAKNLCARTVRNFPMYFRGHTKANLQRASRSWKSRETILARFKNKSKSNGNTVTKRTSHGLRTVVLKASPGRGRKRSPWVTALCVELAEEFDRLRKSGVRFNASILQKLCHRIINNGGNSLIGPEITDPNSGKPIIEHISPRWIQNVMQKNNIVCRSQCGKLIVSPAKRVLIEREVAYHLGKLCREFRDGSLKEDDVMNADETHFVIHMHNQKTLARRAEDEVKYADVVSGDEPMTLLVLLTGGRDSMIQTPFMIFKNANSSYPICGLDDNIPGVSYRTGPKRWIDSRLFGEWLHENRTVSVAHHGRKRVLYVDNCSGHAMTSEVQAALQKKNIELRFFPSNATDLVQPADSHLIQKVKAAWKSRWGDKVFGMIQKKSWVDARTGSGKLANPGKTYFLELAANSIRDVNKARHKRDGVLYSRRAMIRCGLSLNLNGQWEEKQLSEQLRKIIEKYRDNFNGEPVHKEGNLEGEATDTDEEQ